MSPTVPAPALVLFDIDGTLLRRAGPHHRQVLEEAVLEVSGLPGSTDGIATQGMLDGDIITTMLRNRGATARRARELLPRIVERAQSLYARYCPDLSRKVCPGVRALLRRLERRQVSMGLVTGNFSGIGWRKMECAGLRSFFRFGVFAEEGRTRSRLVRLAVARARREKWISRTDVVALVGDHPNDIRAARDNRVRSIAVATGLVGAAELSSHEPDYLLSDLREFRLEMLDALQAACQH